MRAIATLRLLVRVEHLRQLLDRREEQVQVEQERDELADRTATRWRRARCPAPSTIARRDARRGTRRTGSRSRRAAARGSARRDSRRRPPRTPPGCAPRARTPARPARPTGPPAGWRSPPRCARGQFRRPWLDCRRNQSVAMMSGGRMQRGDERELRVHEDECDPDADERHEVDERVDEPVLQQLSRARRCRSSCGSSRAPPSRARSSRRRAAGDGRTP